MNPKGEEGEFYMKKSLLVLASIMILALCTFVACTAEVSDPYDGLTYVTFGGESSTSKNLFASYEVASYDSLYWFYTAEKKDNYGTSGAVENKPVHEGNTGLNNTVGPFSQGKWKFTLSAYKNKDASANTKVYEGSVEVSLKGQKVTVPVSVTPYGETGALEFRGAYFAWKNNSETSTAVPTIMIVAKGTTNGYEYDLSNSFTEIKGENTKKMEIPLVIKEKDSEGKFYIDDTKAKFGSVVADYYTSTIIAYIDDPKTPIFSQTLGFRVYGSATTVIKGDITEQSGTDVNFDPAKQDMAVFKGATTASVKVTPSGTYTTTVDFGADNLDNTSTYYLNVAATSVASAANKFTVSDSTKAPVAGIDIELVKVSSAGGNTKVTEFNGDLVTITTYIEKGLTGVKVYYDGAVCDDNPTYDPEDGKLVFTTNHFSEFYAVSDSVAVVSNGMEEKGYARLVDAIGSSKDGATIKLLKNIELTESIRIGSIDYRKSLTIDFNGYTISGDSSNDSLFCVENSEVVFTGKGFIVDKCSGYGYGAIEAVGSASSESKNYTVVTVGHEITINDGMAVWINHNSNETKESTSYTSYGVVVNFYGTANRGDIEDFVFYVNGKNKKTVNAPVFNIKDATINSPLSRGIYAAGYAVWNIDNTVINSKKAAIEIRAGELNIAGGTFTATADEFSCEANGNGETTVGAAIAVAQHNTKLPINVTISGGTFSGYHALSVMNPQKNEYDAIKEIEVNVTEGTLNSTKEGVEPVNYSSEFIKIGDGSSFTIRARKDGDESNVAMLSDGRYFSSLQDAINGAKEDETVTMLENLSNTSDYSVEGGVNLMIDKYITLKGKEEAAVVAEEAEPTIVISGNICLSVGPNGAAIENIKFENIHNEKSEDGDLFKNVDTAADNPSDYVDLSFKKDSSGNSVLRKGSEGNLSAIYANGLTGSLSITGCTFTNCDWDAIQVYVPAKTAKGEANKPMIDISDNKFSMSEKNGGMRYIHIKTSYNEGNGVAFSKLNVKKNYFFNCENLISSSMDILYLNNADNGVVDLKENFFEGPVCVRIFGGLTEEWGLGKESVMYKEFDDVTLLNNNWAELMFSSVECSTCERTGAYYYVNKCFYENGDMKKGILGMESLLTAPVSDDAADLYFNTVVCLDPSSELMREDSSFWEFVERVFYEFDEGAYMQRTFNSHFTDHAPSEG